MDVSTTLVSGQPEVIARVDRPRAADLGFSVGSVAMQVRGMVEGIVSGKLREGDHEFDIRARLAPAFRNDAAAIAAAPLHSPSGAVVPAGDLVRLVPGVGPSSIDREQRVRQAKVGVDLQGRPLGDVSADIQKAIDAVAIPPSVKVGFAGDVELMQETALGLVVALGLAVTFIYIVLASQFESFTEPLIIMLALPLAVVGALLMLLVTGNHLGMPAMIGIVMLMGLVTKNAILLVDLTNQLRREHGLGVVEALLQAGPVRLRPILMTTFAMILGMVPSSLGLGEGGEFRAPMSLATIGGLITSTLLTLVLVPVAYMLLDRLIARVKVWRRASSPALVKGVRAAGVLFILALIGGVVFVTSAFAQSASRPRTETPPARVLSFDQAMQMALEGNESLKAAEQRIREAEARVSETRTGFLPNVNANYLYTPAQEAAALSIPAGLFGPQPQTFRANFVRQNVVRFDINQPLYTGGRVTNLVAASVKQEDASRLEVERTRQALRLQVVQAYYGALLQQQGIAVAEEGVKRAEQQHRLASVRFEAGTAARLDVLRAEVELSNARARLIRVRSDADISLQSLRAVLSLNDDAPLVLSGSLDQDTPSVSGDVLLEQLVDRPDVRALAAERDSAGRMRAVATAELKPTLALTGNVQYQQDALNELWNGDTRSYQFGVALQVPLFAGPRVAAQKAAATARERGAEHAIAATLDTARLDLTSALRELETARQIVDVQRKTLDLARESLSIAEASYENGVITATELTEARGSLLETEWTLAQAKYGVIVAAARTHFAAGN